MRTLLFLAGGFVLWGACLGLAKLFSGGGPVAWSKATMAFALIWFAVTAWNMWVGVTHAGYSFGEELPIFLGLFLIPTGVAFLVQQKFL